MRRSTAEQEDQRQFESIEQWLSQHNLDLSDIDLYAEQAFAADPMRNQFTELLDEIESGAYDHVVVWGLSRIARKGTQAQRFFDAAEDAETTINVANGSVSKSEPDGHGRLIVGMISAVAAEEQRSLIRRTKAGIKRAK